MFAFGEPRAARRPSMTPMIDVVFLLLVFFMLAARFGAEPSIPLQLGGPGAGAYVGPPRLVEIGPEGLWLNGVAREVGALPGWLAELMQDSGDPVLLRARDGADLQRLLEVIDVLNAAGFGTLMLVE